jgi:CDP-paratose 2-epimerase
LTGPNNFGTVPHRYLAYPMKCGVTGTPYTVYCYMGKQVRDNSNNSGPVLVFTSFAAPASGRGLLRLHRPFSALHDDV